MTGYLHSDYVDALSEFGTPRELSYCGGWILQRPIPDFRYKDAMGPYPLFCCHDWSHLHADVDKIKNDLVSLSLVTDPFGNYDRKYLQQCFKDVVIPFKTHFIIDLAQSPDDFVCNHHQRNIIKANDEVVVEKCAEPIEFLDEWVKFYNNLVERHSITGIQAFSRESFAKQLAVPGIEVFRAVADGSTVSMLLWYLQEDRAYYHLGASNTLGYELSASFALFWEAIEYFKSEGLKWLDLGAGAGIESDSNDGLTRFKRGWSTGSRKAYFCGRIFDHDKYSKIVKAKEISSTDYFPAYRKGEFG